MCCYYANVYSIIYCTAVPGDEFIDLIWFKLVFKPNPKIVSIGLHINSSFFGSTITILEVTFFHDYEYYSYGYFCIPGLGLGKGEVEVLLCTSVRCQVLYIIYRYIPVHWVITVPGTCITCVRYIRTSKHKTYKRARLLY